MALTAEIEILSVATNGRVQAVFNYEVPVPSQLPGANDQNRSVLGVHLSAAEMQEVKDGTIWQRSFSINFPPLTPIGQIGSRLITERDALAATELAIYTQTYEHVGKFYDGSSWGG